MKRLAPLLFVCGLLVPLSAAADTYTETAGAGLFVTSNPEGAAVFIDGDEQGVTPFAIPRLENGEYVLYLRKDGYAGRRFRLVMRPNLRIEVSIDLEEDAGDIVVTVARDPRVTQALNFAPVLFIDDREAGEMPMRLAAGWHIVSAGARGWETVNELAYITRGETTTLALFLVPEGFSPAASQTAPERAAAGRERRAVFYPLTIFSSSSGLFFAPSPEAMPLNAFQTGAGILGGKPLFAEAGGNSAPLAWAARYSFLEMLELAAAVNMNIRFDERVFFGGGLSVKRTFFQPGTGPAGLGAAALASLGAAERGPYTAFGMGTGLSVSVPLALRLFDAPLDIVAAPHLLWAGPAGHPETAVPRTGISAGILYRYKKLLSGGASLRWDYAVSGALPSGSSALSGAGPVMAALEIKLTPARYVISVTGGTWAWKNGSGAFFGAGIGLIY
jgi:hypothetical protein